MSTKSSIDDQLKQVFSQYRRYLLPLVTIFVCVLLFLEIIIPQFQAWQSSQQQAVDARQRIKTMSENIRLLDSLDSKTLDDDLTVVASALPSNQDMYGIVTAINRVGVQSGVMLGDYSFANTAVSGATNGTPSAGDQSVTIILTVSGSIDSINTFITQLKHQLPLADVSSVKISDQVGASSITITFFSKKFPHLTFTDDELLHNVSSIDEKTLTSLRNYEHDASASAEVSF